MHRFSNRRAQGRRCRPHEGYFNTAASSCGISISAATFNMTGQVFASDVVRNRQSGCRLDCQDKANEWRAVPCRAPPAPHSGGWVLPGASCNVTAVPLLRRGLQDREQCRLVKRDRVQMGVAVAGNCGDEVVDVPELPSRSSISRTLCALSRGIAWLIPEMARRSIATAIHGGRSRRRAAPSGSAQMWRTRRVMADRGFIAREPLSLLPGATGRIPTSPSLPTSRPGRKSSSPSTGSSIPCSGSGSQYRLRSRTTPRGLPSISWRSYPRLSASKS